MTSSGLTDNAFRTTADLPFRQNEHFESDMPKLGSGSNGIVFKETQKSPRKVYALKVLKKAYHIDRETELPVECIALNVDHVSTTVLNSILPLANRCQ